MKAGLILVDGCLDEVMLDWQGMSHTGSIGEKLHPVAATFKCADALHCCMFSACMCSEVKVTTDGMMIVLFICYLKHYLHGNS